MFFVRVLSISKCVQTVKTSLLYCCHKLIKLLLVWFLAKIGVRKIMTLPHSPIYSSIFQRRNQYYFKIVCSVQWLLKRFRCTERTTDALCTAWPFAGASCIVAVITSYDALLPYPLPVPHGKLRNKSLQLLFSFMNTHFFKIPFLSNDGLWIRCQGRTAPLPHPLRRHLFCNFFWKIYKLQKIPEIVFNDLIVFIVLICFHCHWLLYHTGFLFLMNLSNFLSCTVYCEIKWYKFMCGRYRTKKLILVFKLTIVS